MVLVSIQPQYGDQRLGGWSPGLSIPGVSAANDIVGADDIVGANDIVGAPNDIVGADDIVGLAGADDIYGVDASADDIAGAEVGLAGFLPREAVSASSLSHQRRCTASMSS